MSARYGPARAAAGPPRRRAEEVEVLVGHLLRYGVLLAALVMAVGLGLMLVRSGGARYDAVPVPASAREVLAGLRRLDPGAITDMGLLILILTPVLRVAASLVAFAAERDRPYTVITFVVLAVIVAGFVLGTAE